MLQRLENHVKLRAPVAAHTDHFTAQIFDPLKFFCDRTQRSAFLVMLRTILSGAPLTAARMAEPPAVVKSMLPVTNAAIPTLVRMTITSASRPSAAKNFSLAARCTGQAESPGEEGAMRIFSCALAAAERKITINAIEHKSMMGRALVY